MNANPTNLILMAEDDADDRLLIQEALTESNLPVELRVVPDGQELMDYLLRRDKYAAPNAAPRPGLVLMDLNMPRKDGRETLREIRSHPDLRRLPVIVFTTSKAETDVELLYELGANSFVAKPVAFDSLVNVIGTMARYWFGIVQLPASKTAAA